MKYYSIILFALLILAMGQSATAQRRMLTNDYFEYLNAFTPNGDEKNDTWSLTWQQRVDSFHITIYNRFGEALFSSDQTNFEWDGLNPKGKPCPEAMYVFRTYIRRYDEVKKIAGELILIR
jgi:gliding motility-associated-like protein